MESHLAQLEDDARRDGASPSEATRRAEARFGSAADHFRHAIEEWTNRQRRVRNALVGLTIAALVVSAGGIVINVRLLGDLRQIIDGWSERTKSSELGFGVARYEGAIIEVDWMSPNGLVRRELPMLVTDWERETAKVPSYCPKRETSRFGFSITAKASEYFPDVPVGATMSCRLKGKSNLDWHEGSAPTSHSDWIRAVGASLRVVDCGE